MNIEPLSGRAQAKQAQIGSRPASTNEISMAVLIIPERIKEEIQKTAVAIKRSRQGRPFPGRSSTVKCQKKKAEKTGLRWKAALNTCSADKRENGQAGTAWPQEKHHTGGEVKQHKLFPYIELLFAWKRIKRSEKKNMFGYNTPEEIRPVWIRTAD